MSTAEATPCVVGLLIAAGRGRRFDPSGRTSKLEQVIDGEWVAVRTARMLAAGCDRVIAVVRPESTALAAALSAALQAIDRRVDFRIVAAVGPEGMGTSIGCGARAALESPDCAAVLVQPADMPWLRADTVARLARLSGISPTDGTHHPIVLPSFQGQDGHPVRFDRSLLPALAALSGESGARALLARHPTLRMATDDAGVVRDLDTPADLAGR